jgi:hypothetical protein
MLGPSHLRYETMQTAAFTVEPGPWSGWLVRRDGRELGVPFPTKTAAVDYARAMAEALAPARVRVRNRNGGTDLDWWARGDARRRAAA